jgi:ribosomal protein S18 acetylase RimI-like enzyme
MPKSTSGSRVLHEEAGFRYSIATEERRDEIVRVLSESFCREPMGVALRVAASDVAPLIARFMPECTSNGLSVIAAPADEPETVAGVFISRDFKSPLPEGVPEEFPWFLPIGQALMTVDEAYEAKRSDLKVGDAVDLWMVGVAEARFARRGIASRLFRICSGVARDSGFMRCVTECTGHYSQTAAQRAGFKEVARLAYKEFRFQGRPVFADIDPPHTHLVLYEREL